MARLGSNGDVSITIGSGFDGQGIDAAKSGMRDLEAETTSVTDKMAAQWQKYAAAAVAALAALELLEKAKEAALLAARVEGLGVVMEVVGRNAGYSKTEMQGFAAGVKAMGITTQQSEQAVIRMTQAHLDLTKASQLARVAQDAAYIANINSSEALETLVHGIQSGRTEILHNIGVMVNFEAAYRRVELQAHRSANSLSAAEQAQVRMNVVLDAGKDIAGTYEAAMGTAGKQITSLARYFEEIALKQGNMLLPALTEGVRIFTEQLKELDGWLVELQATGGTPIISDSATQLIRLAAGAVLMYEVAWQEAAAATLLGTEAIAKFMEMGNRVLLHLPGLSEEFRKTTEADIKSWQKSVADLEGAAIDLSDRAQKRRIEAWKLMSEMAEPKNTILPPQLPFANIKPTEIDAGTIKEQESLVKKMEEDILKAKREGYDKATALAIEYGQKKVEIDKIWVKDHELALQALVVRDKWYKAEAEKIDREQAGHKTEEGKKAAEKLHNEDIDALGAFNKEIASLYNEISKEISNIEKTQYGEGYALAVEYETKKTELLKLGITDMSYLNKEYAMKRKQLDDEYMRAQQPKLSDALPGYDAQLSALQAAQGTKDQFAQMDILRAQEASGKINAIEAAAAREKIVNDAKTNQLRLKAQQDMAAASVNILQALFVATGSKSRELFEMLKIARIAQATVDTWAGATKAMADIPYPYSLAAAAAIVAGGLANVATITSTEMGGGSGGGGSSFGSVGVHGQGGDYKYYNYEQSQYGTGWKPGEGQGPGNVHITINAMDAKSVKQLVSDHPEAFVAPIIQNIKDGGQLKTTIQRYV